MRRRLAVLAPVVVLGAILASLPAAIAHASCAQPQPRAAWTHPADGAVDVPLDARLLVLPTYGDLTVTATVNGAAAATATDSTSDLVQFVLPAMAPGSGHDVVLRLKGTAPGSAWTEQKLHFTAGTAALGPPPGAATIRSHQRSVSDGHLSAACAPLLPAQACHDTGQDTHLRFDAVATGSPAVAWLLGPPGTHADTFVWPASCGLPLVFVRAREDGCFSLRAVDAGGRIGLAGQHCVPFEEAGCSAARTDGPSGLWPVGVAFGLTWLVLRRFRDQGVRTYLLPISATALPKAASQCRCR